MEKLIQHFSGLKQSFDISIILPIENFITFCFIVLLLSILTEHFFVRGRIIKTVKKNASLKINKNYNATTVVLLGRL